MHLPIHPSFLYSSTHPSIISLFIYPSIHHSSIHLSIHPSVITCPDINGTIHNVTNDHQNVTHGSVVTLSCLQGHYFVAMETNQTLECLLSGSWNVSVIPSCSGWIDGWLDGWMKGWISGWMAGWVVGWMVG